MFHTINGQPSDLVTLIFGGLINMESVLPQVRFVNHLGVHGANIFSPQSKLYYKNSHTSIGKVFENSRVNSINNSSTMKYLISTLPLKFILPNILKIPPLLPFLLTFGLQLTHNFTLPYQFILFRTLPA